MKKILLFFAVMFLLSACSQQPALPDITPTPTSTARPSTPTPSPETDDYKNYDLISRIDGSTATIPLSEEILLERLGTIDGLVHNRTHEAYTRLIDGECDLIFVTYPSEEELLTARRNGVKLEVIPVVKDALVFLCNTANKVESLSQKQIRDIYTGETTNWSQVGGANEPITAFQRPENSGSQTLFLKLAMEGLTPASPPLELLPYEMGALIDAVAGYNNANNALGFSVFYYVSDMYGNPNVRLMAVDGVTPTRETIAAGTYPYITYYYAVIREDTPENHPVREIVDWLLTGDGQTVAQRAGYVPMRVFNQRLDERGYGFYGSTPENTTISSGTGGTKPVTTDVFSTKWRNPDDDYRIDISIDNELKRMVNVWVEQTLESFGTYDDTNVYYDLAGDLLNVRVYAYGEKIPPRTENAVFDLNAGKRLKLSDLFYDGVNYIEYINTSLLTKEMPSNLGFYSDYATFDEYFLKRAFTGIPNDYANFSIENNSDGFVLSIYIEGGNPFFDFERYISLGVQLPIDLSPWGLVYSQSYDREDINDKLEILIPRIQTGTKRSSVDDIINTKIRQLADYAIKNNKIEMSDIYDYEEKYLPAIDVWNDNITVGYSAYYSWNDIYVIQDYAITINLRTGETVDASAYLPDEWWKLNCDAEYRGEEEYPVYIDNYIPPDGYSVENVFINSWFCSFVVVEPDGRKVNVRVYYR